MEEQASPIKAAKGTEGLSPKISFAVTDRDSGPPEV